MKNTRESRSRMTGNCHVRFCSRVEVVTLPLRQQMQIPATKVPAFSAGKVFKAARGTEGLTK